MYERALSPIRIGGLTIKNRIARAAPGSAARAAERPRTGTRQKAVAVLMPGALAPPAARHRRATGGHRNQACGSRQGQRPGH